MPKKRTKLVRKKKRKKNRFSRVPRLLGDSIITKMRYVTGFNLNPTGATMVSNAFRANGITVCNITTGIGQPTGFDQFNAFFNRYRVLKSTISMQFVPISFSNLTVPSVYGVYQDNDATLAYSDYQTLLMGNQSQTKNVKMAGLIQGGLALQKTGATYSAKKTYINTASQDLVLGGDALLNPDESQYFQCWAASPNIGADPPAAHYLIQIDYVVQWYDKKLTIGSTAPA